MAPLGEHTLFGKSVSTKLGYGLLLGLIVGAWLHTARDFFIGDDFGYVALYSRFSIWEWPRLFWSEWSQGIWGYRLSELRPFAALSFLIDAKLWGADPLGYHLTNLGLHVACTAMVGALARALIEDDFAALLGAVLFGLHPVHAEPVVWITGRVDAIASLFYLASLWSFARFRQTSRHRFGAIAVASCFAGVFSKEFCLTIPLLLVILDLCSFRARVARRWRDLWPHAGCVGVIAIYALCRLTAIGATSSLHGPGFSVEAICERQLQYLTWLFQIPKSTHLKLAPHAELILLGVTIALCLGVWFARRKSSVAVHLRLWAFLGAWYLVATLPLMVTYVSKRHLYFASGALCVGLAILAARFLKKHYLRWTAFIALGVSHALWLQSAFRFWHEAALRSQSAHQLLVKTVRSTEAHSADLLLVDIPESHRGAWIWAWAHPFLLHPPFVNEPLDQRQQILTRPAIYAQSAAWSHQPILRSLGTFDGTARVLSLDDDGVPKIETIAPEFVRNAAGALTITSSPSDEAWRNFMRALP